MKKIVFKVLLLIVAFTNVAWSDGCGSNEIKVEFKLKKSESLLDKDMADNYEIEKQKLALTSEFNEINSYNRAYWNFLEKSGYISESTRAAVDLNLSRRENEKKYNYEQLMTQLEFQKTQKNYMCTYQVKKDSVKIEYKGLSCPTLISACYNTETGKFRSHD